MARGQVQGAEGTMMGHLPAKAIECHKAERVLSAALLEEKRTRAKRVVKAPSC